LNDRVGGGRKSTMNLIQLESIKKLVLTENLKDHGYDLIKWTCPILVHWIQREFGLQYQKAQIYVLLNKVGIIFQKKKGFILNV
jgi:transposase